MTRRRSSAPGGLPARRRSLPLLLLLALVAAAACGASDVPTGEPTPTDDAGPTSTLPAPSEGATDGLAPSEEPVPTEDPVATDTPEPTETGSPSPASSDGAAAGCAGNDDNRVFYASVADSVDWPVYCPVLPAGWFVDSGEYKSAGGGWMRIAYKGPGGTRLELSEGFFCTTDDGCVPAGSDVGPAAFGGLEGTLVAATDGRSAIVVDRGSSPSWVVVASGLDVGMFTDLAADFALVEG